jgi:TonB family protein
LGIALMPWNPALWWQLRRLRAALEIDCDARVLAAHRDVTRYGLLLLAVAQRRATPLRGLAGAPALAESTSDLSRRITAMRTPLPRRRLLRTAIGLASAAIAVAAAFVACSTTRDVVGPNRSTPQRVVGLGEPKVRQLDSVFITAAAPDDTAAARLPNGTTVMTVMVDSTHRVAERSALPRKVPSDGPYFEFQVEQPVVPAPGNVGPRYPDSLRVAKVEGEVLAQFVVDTSGHVMPGSFKVLKSDHDLFTKAVAAALPNMKFVPAEVGGRKVRQLVQEPFQFSLAH